MARIDESKYIKVIEITNRNGKRISVETFKKYVPEYKIIKINGANCIEYKGNRQEVINTLNARLTQPRIPKPRPKPSKIQNPYDVIEASLNSYGDVAKHKYPELFRTFREYVFGKLNRSNATPRAKMIMVSSAKNAFDCLINNLNGDIDTIKEKDLANLLNLNYSKIRFLNGYFNYLKDIKAIPIYLNMKLYYNGKIPSMDEFYTKEEWAGYINFTIDIDKHLEKAMNDVMYAKCWLYMLFNQCVMWRMNDILSLPKLDNLLGIEKYNLTWFENNSFTMEDANSIIERTKSVVSNINAHKTQTPLHFDISKSFRIPLAIAIITLENWRRRIGYDKLFGSTMTLSSNDLVGKMGNEAKGFTNRKANKAVASFLNDTARELGINGYSYISYMRSHKHTPDKLSDITSRYIRGSYSQRDIDELLIDLYSRGPFGWLWDLILDVGMEDREKDESQTFKKTTNSIVALKGNLSEMEINNMATILTNQKLSKQEVVNEVLEMDKGDIETLVKNINNGLAYGTQQTFGCFKDKCPYELNTHCVYCEYSIPTIHSMMSIFNELNKMLETPLSNCLYDNWRHIDKLLKLFRIIKEAKTQHGEEFLLPYINDIGFKDYSELKDRIKEKYNSYIKEGKIYGE